MKTRQEYRAMFCPPCKKYEDRWREAYKQKYSYQGLMTIDNLLQEMLKESREISQDVREHVVESGICEGCPNTSIYDKDRIEDLIFLGRDMKGFLSDRSIEDVQKILTAFGQAMEETNNDPYEASILFLDKLEEYKIDF